MNALGMPFAMVELVYVARFTRDLVVADFCLRIYIDSLCLHEAPLPENWTLVSSWLLLKPG